MPEQCKKIVHGGSRRHLTWQCNRRAWKDGFCKQHHPTSVKARREKRNTKWDVEGRIISLRSKLYGLHDACVKLIMTADLSKENDEAKSLASQIRAIRNALVIERRKLEKLG